MPNEKQEGREKTAQPPQCCPYCSDSKFPCVKMQRSIEKAVRDSLKDELGKD
jgi:hypothetical protein